MVAAGCYNTRDEYQGAVIIFIRVLHREDVGRNRMMQGVAVFVDCFPFIRGSHFVDPVWVIVRLVFGSFVRVCICILSSLYDFRVVGGRYWGSFFIFSLSVCPILKCPFLAVLIEIIPTSANIRWAGCIALGSVIIRSRVIFCCINDCGFGAPKDG